MSDYKIREANERDLHWVVKSWLDSYRSSHSAGLLSLSEDTAHCRTCGETINYDYRTVMEHIARRILARKGVKVFVASNPREKPPLDLHGWIAVETDANIPLYRPPTYKVEVVVSTDPLVHYVYVKKIYRQHGLARALFKAAGVDPMKRFIYTCHTALAVAVEKAGKVPRAEWAPLSARFTKETSQIHDQERRTTPVQQPGASADPRERSRGHHE